MAINIGTPYNQSVTTAQPTQQYYPTPNSYTVYTRFVSSEQEALAQPNPVTGCAFFIDGSNMVLYVKYADNRPMEIYDMKLREATTPHYLTADELSEILDSKLEDLSKRFVLRKENRGGNQNG